MRKLLAAGFILLLPLALTLMVVSFLFDLFTSPFLPVINAIFSRWAHWLPADAAAFVARLLALILLCLFILGLGAVARYFFFKRTLKLTHELMSRVPLVNSVYKVSRDLSSALFSSEGKQAFQEAVLIPFPDKPYLCLGFSTGDAPEECRQKIGAPLTAVFAPTAPHPISGFLLFVPTEDVRPAQMSKEDALKFFVSCGVVLPERKEP